MNPWLERQTQFNHAADSYLRSVHGYLADVADRVNALQAELARQAIALNSQPEPTACCGRHGGGPGTEIPDDPIRVVEDLFLDTRLPPPPARVLVLTPNGQSSLDLASRGYQVVQCAADVGPVAISERRSRPSDTDGKWPFPDESFDVAAPVLPRWPVDLAHCGLSNVCTRSVPLRGGPLPRHGPTRPI